MKYFRTLLIVLAVIFYIDCFGLLVLTSSSLETTLAAHKALQSKSQHCALKASLLANTIDPRYYSESTIKRAYEMCLKE